MSVVVRIGADRAGESARADSERRDGRRRRELRLLAAIGGATLLALGAIPLPSFRHARALESKRDEVRREVDAMLVAETAARAWEQRDRGAVEATSADYRRWFAPERRLLETRNHVLRVTRSLGIQVMQAAVSGETEPAAALVEPEWDGAPELAGETPEPERSVVAPAPGRFAIPATAELVQLVGRGGFAEVLLLGAMLPKLDPPLRIVSFEISGTGTWRDFTLLCERFFEQAGASGPVGGPAGAP